MISSGARGSIPRKMRSLLSANGLSGGLRAAVIGRPGRDATSVYTGTSRRAYVLGWTGRRTLADLEWQIELGATGRSAIGDAPPVNRVRAGKDRAEAKETDSERRHTGAGRSCLRRSGVAGARGRSPGTAGDLDALAPALARSFEALASCGAARARKKELHHRLAHGPARAAEGE